MGHLFLYVEDVTVATSFYCDVLGFEVTDYIVWPEAGIDAVFLRCNARHHSIALGKGRPPDQIGTLEHIMLEARSIDDVGRAMDAVIRAEVPLFSTLGRHINDRMLSFYACAPPSGILVEYGCDALQVPNGSSWGGLSSIRRVIHGGAITWLEMKYRRYPSEEPINSVMHGGVGRKSSFIGSHPFSS